MISLSIYRLIFYIKIYAFDQGQPVRDRGEERGQIPGGGGTNDGGVQGRDTDSIYCLFSRFQTPTMYKSRC